MARSDTEVLLLRTQILFEADAAASLLESEGIPFYRRFENSAGVEFAMPAAPAPGPTAWFTIWVPREAETQARELLNELPAAERAAPRPHRAFRILAWMILLMAGLGFLQQCGSAMRMLFRR